MTIIVRQVTLSPGADELLQQLAHHERLAPDVLGSLLLELAVRERHDFVARFSAAAAKIGNGALR